MKAGSADGSSNLRLADQGSRREATQEDLVVKRHARRVRVRMLAALPSEVEGPVCPREVLARLSRSGKLEVAELAIPLMRSDAHAARAAGAAVARRR